MSQLHRRLGAGFAFVGRQYRLDVGGDESFVDMLFYHLCLHRYIVIELKSGRFKPEYAGQLNFYVKAVDDLLRAPSDGLTIGILLCASRNEHVVRYALHSINTPMAVAGYTYRELPDDVCDALPTDSDLDATVRWDSRARAPRELKALPRWRPRLDVCSPSTGFPAR